MHADLSSVSEAWRRGEIPEPVFCNYPCDFQPGCDCPCPVDQVPTNSPIGHQADTEEFARCNGNPKCN